MRSRNICSTMVCHVFNRSAKKLALFKEASDYQDFVNVLAETQLRQARQGRCVPVISYCLMPNHWHLVTWPDSGKALSSFLHRLTLTHAQRWARAQERTGSGAVYQGRFRAIPVQSDAHLLVLLRYVERNPVRAGLVRRAEDWVWSSAASRPETAAIALAESPVPRPANWLAVLNTAEPEAELDALRSRIDRSVPFGNPSWAAAHLVKPQLSPAPALVGESMHDDELDASPWWGSRAER